MLPVLSAEKLTHDSTSRDKVAVIGSESTDALRSAALFSAAAY